MIKTGDRVSTPGGPGTVFTVRTRYVWTGLYSRARGYVQVELDRDGRVHSFPAANVKPVEEETDAGVV